MSDPLKLLHAPLGEPGSGRVRYGAAMALFRSGLLSEAALEVYRICSPLDAQDPGPLLLEGGLRVLPRKSSAASVRLSVLLAEAERYLAALQGPGVLEVRSILAKAVAVSAPPRQKPNRVAQSHLGAALDGLGVTHPALSAAIADATPDLDWITYDRYPPDEIGADFAAGHAYVSIVGAGAPFDAGDFDFGLFLIAPNILYRDHAHAAPELYAPLTGPHGWRFAPGAPLQIRPAHVPVWNEPNQAHLTKVGPNPFLCLFGWTRDAQSPAHVLAAEDWAELEALRL